MFNISRRVSLATDVCSNVFFQQVRLARCHGTHYPTRFALTPVSRSSMTLLQDLTSHDPTHGQACSSSALLTLYIKENIISKITTVPPKKNSKSYEMSHHITKKKHTIPTAEYLLIPKTIEIKVATRGLVIIYY
jgi:hypothetical protein